MNVFTMHRASTMCRRGRRREGKWRTAFVCVGPGDDAEMQRLLHLALDLTKNWRRFLLDDDFTGIIKV